MPLDNSNYISDMNLNNPVGNIDTVSMTDDFFREIKKTIKQSFPNINKQTTITSDELNNLKSYMVRSGSTWDVKNSTIINVIASDNNNAVQPRSYNDNRYMMRSRNLTDLTDVNGAVNHLMANLPSGGSGYNSMRVHVINMTYPVGTVYMNYSRDNNPRDFFGTGTWAAYAQARAIVGAGYTSDTRGEGRTIGRGASGGEFQHVLNIHEIPSHTHGVPLKGSNRSGHNAITSSADNGQPTVIQSHGAGGNGAHNNMQPYIAVAIWVRTG